MAAVGKEFKTNLMGAIYVPEVNGSTSTVINLVNSPNTLIAVQKQTYPDPISGSLLTSVNLVVLKDVKIDTDEKLSYCNGSNRIKSTLYLKSMRHCEVMTIIFASRQMGEKNCIQIYDNDLDRKNNGSQVLQFNKGLKPVEHDALEKEGVE